MEVVEAPQNSEARGMNGPWAAHSPHGKMEEHGMNGLGAAYSPRCKMKRHCLQNQNFCCRHVGGPTATTLS